MCACYWGHTVYIVHKMPLMDASLCPIHNALSAFMWCTWQHFINEIHLNILLLVEMFGYGWGDIFHIWRHHSLCAGSIWTVNNWARCKSTLPQPNLPLFTKAWDDIECTSLDNFERKLWRLFPHGYFMNTFQIRPFLEGMSVKIYTPYNHHAKSKIQRQHLMNAGHTISMRIRVCISTVQKVGLM